MIEVLAVVAILATLTTVTFQEFARARGESRQKSREADARTLNDAVVRVQLEGRANHWHTLSNILFVDQDTDAAIDFLKSNNYVRMPDKN